MKYTGGMERRTCAGHLDGTMWWHWGRIVCERGAGTQLQDDRGYRTGRISGTAQRHWVRLRISYPRQEECWCGRERYCRMKKREGGNCPTRFFGLYADQSFMEESVLLFQGGSWDNHNNKNRYVDYNKDCHNNIYQGRTHYSYQWSWGRGGCCWRQRGAATDSSLEARRLVDWLEKADGVVAIVFSLSAVEGRSGNTK